MVAPLGPSPGVARVVSLRSLRVPPRHYLPGTAWGKVQEYARSSDTPGGLWDLAAVTEPDPYPPVARQSRMWLANVAMPVKLLGPQDMAETLFAFLA